MRNNKNLKEDYTDLKILQKVISNNFSFFHKKLKNKNHRLEVTKEVMNNFKIKQIDAEKILDHCRKEEKESEKKLQNKSLKKLIYS